MDSNVYDADYFLRGRESGKSLYCDYRWLPELTIPMCMRMMEHLRISKVATVLDFGCATGYAVKAFRKLGVLAYGVDVSQWAVDNADKEAAPYIRRAPWHPRVDWVVAKDVLEHVVDVTSEVQRLMDCAKVGVFAVVPLSAADGDPYVVQEYEKDVTHVHRLTLAAWTAMFLRPDWEVTVSYKVRGIKDNYFDAQLHPHHFPEWEMGNGFITARRT